MYFFDRWARTIAAGDWLTEQPLHPHTFWHRVITEPYLAEHPEAVAAILRDELRTMKEKE